MKTYYQGPPAFRADKVNANTMDVHLMHRGGTDFMPLKNISGWQALNLEVLVSIIGVWHLDRDTVRIQLGTDVAGACHLALPVWARPDAAHAIRDNSEIKLPLEPVQHLETQ